MSREKGRKALLLLEAMGHIDEQGSINTGAAGFLCAWVCCLISSLSFFILGMRYYFFNFCVLD